MPTPTIDARYDMAKQIQSQRAWISAMINGYFLLDGCDRRLPTGFLFSLVEQHGNYADFTFTQDRKLACYEEPLVDHSVTQLLHEYLIRSYPAVRREAVLAFFRAADASKAPRASLSRDIPSVGQR
jgi:hypothetical protein